MTYYSGSLLVLDNIDLINIIDYNYVKPVPSDDVGDCTNYYMWRSDRKFEWVDHESIGWGACEQEHLNQVCIDDSYVYTATSMGVDIIDVYTNNKVSYVDSIVEVSSVWASEERLYIGTAGEGIKYIDKVTISGNEVLPIDLEEYVCNYSFQYSIDCEFVKYIHGSGETLSVVTYSGINILNNTDSIGYKSSYTSTDVTKCFMTSKNELYYIEQGEINGVFKMKSTLCDWTSPNILYTSGSSFLPGSLGVNDIFVTESTSSNTVDNTLFVATSSGAYILDEGTANFDVYYT